MRKKDPNSLNKREKAILKFIEKQINANGYPPSVREIGKAVDLKSTATVHGYISSLEKKGYIKKESQKGRTKSNVRANQLTLTNVDDDYELQTMYVEADEQPYMGFDKEAFHEDTDLDSLLKGRPGQSTPYDFRGNL